MSPSITVDNHGNLHTAGMIIHHFYAIRSYLDVVLDLLYVKFN